METNNNKTFIVYFEIFGSRKKYTVNNPNVKSQSEAENYVRYVLIPNNTKFVTVSNQKENLKSVENLFENFEKKFDKIFEGFDDIFDNMFGKKSSKK